MKCIQFHSSFPSLQPHPKHNQQLQTQKFLCPSSQQPASRLHKLGQRLPIRTRAINPLILADTSPAKGGDISVLIQTGGLLLFVYGIANFVVPAFITKNYQFDKETEDSVPVKDTSVVEEEGTMPKPTSLRKKRGFQGNRT